MNFAGLLFLLLAHYTTGNGLIHLFRLRLSRTVNFALSMICGVLILSLIPFVLQLFYIPITILTITISILLSALLLNLKRLLTIRSFKIKPVTKLSFNKPLYEWIFIGLFILLMIPSVWKCFYMPPYARDMLSGPEIIADYTVKEHTMLNSVLSLNLESTNNHLKPPFVTDLQIIYKLFVHPFGQLWLSVIAISFLIWLYAFLKEKLHPVLAGISLLLFIGIPSLYGYTYVILFDYSNMVLFFAGVYFLTEYMVRQEDNLLWFSILMFGFATSIRSDTLVLVCMFVPLLLFYALKHKTGIVKSTLHTIAFVGIPYFFYFIWVDVYLKYYMPGDFSVANEINKNLGDVSVFFNRMGDITTQYLFGGYGVELYAYYIHIFCILLIADLIVTKKLNTEAKIALYSLAVLYVGLPLLGYLLPLFDLENTTKRGLYKMMPLILILFRNNSLLQKASVSIYNWENAVNNTPAQAVAINRVETIKKKKRK